MIRIAVDAMGGDQAPAAIVDGAVAAARHLDIQIALVGVPTQVEQALDAHPDWRSLPVTVVDAPEVIETLLGDELRGTFSSQVGYLLSRRAFRRFRRRVDSSEYGGAPLLGVGGLVIVGHGRSSPKAVRNAIAMAYRFAAGDFIQRVEHEIAAATVSRH